MDAMLGVIRGGRVEFETPTRLPDGTRVRVEPAMEDEGFLAEDEWPTTPEGIAEHARKMTHFDPVILTEADRTQIAAARSTWRQYETAAVRKEMGLDP